MQPTPAEAIRERIRRDGPITFATFMELALYGPGGFYDTPPVGAAGDFVTSPHVHPAFGSFVARALEPLREALGAEPLRLAELGAGDGTLARQILSSSPGIDYTAIEISRGAREALVTIEGVRVAEELEPPVDVIIAHELLDNLPFRLTRGHDEVRIDLDGDALVERRVPPSDGLVIYGDADDPDEERVVPVGVWAAFGRIADTLERGYTLVIDYGDDGATGPAHGYRQHQPVDDLLAAPGTTDITAGVDFGWLANAATEQGLQVFGPTDQVAVLRSLGFDTWLRDELEVQREQLAAGAGLDAVRTWSGRSRATLLVDPSGLGRMRWLLLATPGLPAPDWVAPRA